MEISKSSLANLFKKKGRKKPTLSQNQIVEIIIKVVEVSDTSKKREKRAIFSNASKNKQLRLSNW